MYNENDLINIGRLIMGIELLRDGHATRDSIAMELDINPDILTPYMGNFGQYKPMDLAQKLLPYLKNWFFLSGGNEYGYEIRKTRLILWTTRSL